MVSNKGDGEKCNASFSILKHESGKGNGKLKEKNG